MSLLAFAFCGCHEVSPPLTSHEATVERIDERPGDHYTPAGGHIPAVQIVLRAKSGPNTGRIVNLLLLDVYNPGKYGRRGDTVVFATRSALPVSGELSAEQLASYRVIQAQR